MKRYTIKLIIISSLILVGCKFSNLQIKGDVEKLQGNWVNQDDPKWILTFREDDFFDRYENEKENCKYQISETSCDKEYADVKGTFIKFYCNYEFCCEVMGLTDSTFSYRETTSGKNHVFKKADQGVFNSLD